MTTPATTPADPVWTLIEKYADAVSLYNEAVRIDVGIDKAGTECLKVASQLRAALATPSPGKAEAERLITDYIDGMLANDIEKVKLATRAMTDFYMRTAIQQESNHD